MTIFDSDLIDPTQANASLGGVSFRVNPNSATLSYNVKTAKTQTVGGMVVQVYGVTLSDLVVDGYFGTGGAAEQQRFYSYIQSVVTATAAAQKAQPNLSQVGNDVVLSTGSVRFTLPLLNYDFQVYVKGYASIEGDAVVQSNTNFNPSWQLTLLIENDNTGLLTTTVANSYISRVAAGLGTGILDSSGHINKYLGSQASDITDFLSKYGGGASSFAQYIAQAYGGTAGAAVNSSTPSPTAPQSSASGNEATIWNYLAAKGLPAAGIAGIMGSLQQESGFNPESLQPFPDTSPTPPWPPYTSQRGYGIAQWTDAGRQQGLQNLADTMGQPVNSLSVQLAYLWQELQGNYASTLAAMQAATDPVAAALAFCQGYEGGTDPGGIRESNAQAIYASFVKK